MSRVSKFDCGSVYESHRTWAYRGTNLTQNLLFNVGRASSVCNVFTSCGRQHLYQDALTMGVTAQDNIMIVNSSVAAAYPGHTNCLTNNGGRDNIIRNNLCVGAAKSIDTSDCGITWYAAPMKNYSHQQQVLKAWLASNVSGPVYRKAFPVLRTMDAAVTFPLIGKGGCNHNSHCPAAPFHVEISRTAAVNMGTHCPCSTSGHCALANCTHVLQAQVAKGRLSLPLETQFAERNFKLHSNANYTALFSALGFADADPHASHCWALKPDSPLLRGGANLLPIDTSVIGPPSWRAQFPCKTDDGGGIVGRDFLWRRPPVRIPSNSTVDAPLIGNGELGVALGGDLASNNLTLFMGANSFWSAPTGGISQCGFRDADNLYDRLLGAGGGVRQLGGLTLQAPVFAGKQHVEYKAQQHVGNASVVLTQTRADGATLRLSSSVLAEENTIVSDVLFSAPAAVRSLELVLTLWTRGGCSYGSSDCARNSTFPPLGAGLINDKSSFPACTFPTTAGLLEHGGYVSRGAGLRYQQTKRFNVTTAAVGVSVLLSNGSAANVQASVISANSKTGDDAVQLKLNVVRSSGQAGSWPAMTVVSIMRTSNEVRGALPPSPKPDTRATDAVKRRAKELSSVAALRPLRAAHAAWWRSFWSRSSVSITSKSGLGKQLDTFYRGSLYMLGSSSRGTNVAPGLYGPWATTDHPLWGSDYHLDYNMQAAFYGQTGANRPELGDSYFRAMLQFVPKAREDARDEFGCAGLNYAGAIGPYGELSTHVGDMGMRQDAGDTACYCQYCVRARLRCC